MLDLKFEADFHVVRTYSSNVLNELTYVRIMSLYTNMTKHIQANHSSAFKVLAVRIISMLM